MFLKSLGYAALNSSLTLALALVGGCVETTDGDNDQGGTFDSGAVAPGPGSVPGGGGGAGGAQSDGGGATSTSDAGGFAGGSMEGGSADAGGTGGTDGGTADGGTISFAGKHVGCTSYGTPTGDKCAGYYCKLTKADLAPAFPTTGKCSIFTAERVCAGALTVSVGKCARAEKTLGTALLLNDAQIRANTETCIYKDAQFADVPKECMSCFLDAAQCAGDKCSAQCLTADPGSAACDKCRMDNNCNQPAPACAGLPNPF